MEGAANNPQTTETTQPPVGGGGGEAPARPDWFPEKFWSPDAARAVEAAPEPVQKLAQSYRELESRQGNLKESLKAEIDAERFKDRPASPDDYKIESPTEDTVFLTEKPGEGFEPEEGKRYFVFDKEDPLYQWWKDTAHQMGLGQDGFVKGLEKAAEFAGQRVTTPEEEAAARQEVYKALGENGEARAAHVWKQLVAAAGEEGAKAIETAMFSPDAINAIETVLEKAGAPKFSGEGAPSAALSEQDLRAMMQDPKYWRDADPEFVRQVDEGWRRLTGGR